MFVCSQAVLLLPACFAPAVKQGMAPKGIRARLRLKAQSKAAARRSRRRKATASAQSKTIPKAQSKAAAARKAAYRKSEVRVVYVSKVLKTPATFFNLAEMSVKKYIFTGQGFVGFTPTAQDRSHWPVMKVILRTPLNRAARVDMENFDAAGIIDRIVRDDGVMGGVAVQRKCLQWGYPLW